MVCRHCLRGLCLLVRIILPACSSLLLPMASQVLVLNSRGETDMIIIKEMTSGLNVEE